MMMVVVENNSQIYYMRKLTCFSMYVRMWGDCVEMKGIINIIFHEKLSHLYSTLTMLFTVHRTTKISDAFSVSVANRVGVCMLFKTSTTIIKLTISGLDCMSLLCVGWRQCSIYINGIKNKNWCGTKT